MNTHLPDSEWREAAADHFNLPVTYHVQLAPELVRELRRFAEFFDNRPETIIAEALRAYLGVDA